MGATVAGSVGRVDRDLQAIGALTQAVLDGDDLEQLLGRIAGEARVLANAVSGVVVTVAPDTGLMTFRAVDGLSVGPLQLGHVMPVAGTLTELALSRGEDLVVEQMADMPPAGQAFAAAIGVGPLVAAPLASIGPARGVLLVARRAESPPFGRADVALVSTFAAQAASAIALVDLRTTEADLAAHAERERIAADLHVAVIRALRDLQAGLRALAPDAAGAFGAEIVAVSNQLDEAIATIGLAVTDLRATAGANDRVPADRLGGEESQLHGRRPLVRPAAGVSRDSAATIAVIGDLARGAAGESATVDVLDSLVREVLGRTAAQLAMIGTLADDGTSILVRSRAGANLPGRGVGDRIPIGETVVGEAIRLGRPIVGASPAALSSGIPAAVANVVGPMVAIPLKIRGHRFGAMAIARSPGSAGFSRSDVALMEAYGVQAAIALEFERVRGEIRTSSVSVERDRVGRDLHQQVVQMLTGVAFALQALQSTVADASVRVSLQATVEGLDRVVRDLRRIVFGLGPGPGPAVDDQVQALVEDNARLQSEINEQLAEVKASRVRIIAAGDAERKRVERDLHDGAQQRLVSLTLALRLARSRLGDDMDPSALLSLDQAASDAKAALAELRELARGIHPQILTEAGLGPAVESLAARSPVGIRVEIGESRFSPAVEGAAYFTISEALANVSKYAQANETLVRAGTLDDHLLVEVIDDGVGGADPATGTGLRGLADRLESVNGSLDVRSPLGEGTHLLARIPVDTRA